MTAQDKKDRMDQRDAELIVFYERGNTLTKTAKKFRISRQRALQILQVYGVWKPYVKTDRTKFLGVFVTKEDKKALKAEADRRGVSMSKLSADVIKEMLAKRDVA